MKRTVLQVPMTPELREKAEKVANEQGFTSIQDLIRLFLSHYSEKKIHVGFEEKPVQLSARNERRYNKMMEDIESGKVKTKSFDNVDDLIADLTE